MDIHQENYRNLSNKIEWESDQYLDATELMNKLGVPKEDEHGQVYSLVGRIYELMRMCEYEKYPDRILSKSDYVDILLNKKIN